MGGGRSEKAGNRDEREAGEEQYLHDLLQRLRLHRADDVDRGQRRDAERGVNCRAVPAERDDLRGVVAEYERYRGNGPGLDHRHARPGENEGGAASPGAREEGVFAAGLGIARRELGVDQRAAQRHSAAQCPGEHELGAARGVAATIEGALKMPAPMTMPADEHDPVANRKQRLRRAAHFARRLPGQRSLAVAVGQRQLAGDAIAWDAAANR